MAYLETDDQPATIHAILKTKDTAIAKKILYSISIMSSPYPKKRLLKFSQLNQ